MSAFVVWFSVGAGTHRTVAKSRSESGYSGQRVSGRPVAIFWPVNADANLIAQLAQDNRQTTAPRMLDGSTPDSSHALPPHLDNQVSTGWPIWEQNGNRTGNISPMRLQCTCVRAVS